MLLVNQFSIKLPGRMKNDENFKRKRFFLLDQNAGKLSSAFLITISLPDPLILKGKPGLGPNGAHVHDD